MIEITLTYEYTPPSEQFPFWCTATATVCSVPLRDRRCGTSWADCRERALASMKQLVRQAAHGETPLPPEVVTVEIQEPEAVSQG